jgi:hypothetical protein
MLAQYVSGLQIGLGVNSQATNGFALFPNPSDHFILEIDYSQSQDLIYSITDILGREIKRESFKTGFGRNTIDVSFNGGYGVYILKVFDGQKLLYTQKLIKNE